MSFTVRAHAAIRAAILADWRTRYLAKGYDLDTAEDSDAWCWADAIAFQVEGLEAKALALTKELFPDTASTTFLERHADVIGLTRKAATAAVLTAEATGTNGSTWTTSDKITAADGTVYKPTAGGTVSGGVGTVTLQAQSTGSSTNKAAGTVLTWSSAPSGINSTLEVQTQETIAVDAEDDEDFAARVLAWWQERPGGGNRADWVDWATSQAGIESAFVYPLRHDTLGDGTLGAVTLVVLGPPPTTETAAGEPASSAYRFIDTGSDGEEGTLADLQALIEGTGTHATEGGKASASMDGDDIFVKTATALPQAISLALTLGSGYAWSFSGTFTLTSGSTTTVLKASATPPATLAIGDWIAIPDTAVRGGFAYRQVTAINTNDITVSPALDNAPANGSTIRPLPQYGSGASATTNAHSIRDAVLALIDALGPGQGTAPSERWPADGGASYPSRLYKSAVTAAVMGVPGLAGAPAGVNGISNVVVTLTASPDPEVREPDAEEIVTLSTLTLA
mgnify:FL=1